MSCIAHGNVRVAASTSNFHIFSIFMLSPEALNKWNSHVSFMICGCLEFQVVVRKVHSPKVRLIFSGKKNMTQKMLGKKTIQPAFRFFKDERDLIRMWFSCVLKKTPCTLHLELMCRRYRWRPWQCYLAARFGGSKTGFPLGDFIQATVTLHPPNMH